MFFACEYTIKMDVQIVALGIFMKNGKTKGGKFEFEKPLKEENDSIKMKNKNIHSP